ncbi:MAG: hypothetical protein IT437_02865 [Phycisphaerales bacterium]|nr:hypothetical protein [Phycisphaerales bacterium]
MSEAGTAPRRARAIAGFIVGLALLAAAIWVVAGQGDALRRAAAAARTAPVWMIVPALLLPIVNVLLMAAVFQELMRSHGRVAPAEMTALIGASWLLNFLPLRPGLLGRVAYHKAVNHIPVSGSVRAVVGNIAAGFVALVFGALLVLAGRTQDGEGFGETAYYACIALIVMPVLAARAVPKRRPLLVAVALRFVDLLVWALRYWLIFRIVGSPIDAPAALAVAVVSQAASLVPLVGNGLGLREWAVGLTVASLPRVFASGTATGIGLTADLVNRAAEVLTAVPVGLVSIAYLHRLSRSSPARAGEVA